MSEITIYPNQCKISEVKFGICILNSIFTAGYSYQLSFTLIYSYLPLLS